MNDLECGYLWIGDMVGWMIRPEWGQFEEKSWVNPYERVQSNREIGPREGDNPIRLEFVNLIGWIEK